MKPGVGLVCFSGTGQQIFEGLYEVLSMEAKFFIPLLRNNAFIGHGCDIQDTFCKQPNVFILEQNPVIGYADLHIRISKCLELFQCRNTNCKRLFYIQSAVITAACTMSFQRPDVSVLEQNTCLLYTSRCV